jgi:hypothetical protein
VLSALTISAIIPQPRLRSSTTRSGSSLLGDYLGDAGQFSRSQQDVLHISTEVMETILKRAADRGEARPDVGRRIATLPTDLFRNELFRSRTPPSEGTLVEIVDDVFLPLVRTQ